MVNPRIRMTSIGIRMAPALAPEQRSREFRNGWNWRRHWRLDPAAGQLQQPRRRPRDARPHQPDRTVAAGRVPGYSRANGPHGDRHDDLSGCTTSRARIPAQDGRPSIIWLVLVTKPKQNLTFQSVASRQKSGEVVPQQSSTSTQL